MMFNPFGGKALDVQVEVDRADQPYRPGETVHATIGIKSDQGGRARELRAGLVLRYSYEVHWVEITGYPVRHESSRRETQDYEDWLHSEILHEGPIPANFEQTFSFDWTIPADSPPTCQGDKTMTTYLVKVTLDRAMALDQNEERELTVVVAPTGQEMTPGDDGTNDSPDDVRLRLWLPKLELIEGETIAGRVSVEPIKSFDVQEIRLELRRHEWVRGPHPNASGGQDTGGTPFRDNTFETVDQQVQLASKTALQPGSPLQYDFELVVPESDRPTLQTLNTQLSYEIVATLDRRMRSDCNIRQDVTVYNGSTAE